MNNQVLRLKLTALFAFLSLYLYVRTTAAQGQDRVFLWFLLGSPSLISLLLPASMRNFARGLAMGQSIVLGTISGVSGFLGLFVLISARQSASAEFDIVVVFAAHCALLLSATRGTPELPTVKNRNTTTVWLSAAGSAALLVLGLGRWEDISEHEMTPNGVYRVIACAESYAEHRGGEYPESLQTMVQAAREWLSPNCIYPFDSNGRGKYGQLRYSPVKSAQGRVIGYSLLFGPRTFFGNLNAAEFIDQTGIIHVPKSNRIATASDPVRENVSSFLAKWSRCLVEYRQTHPGVAFPIKLENMFRTDWPCKPTRDVEGNHIAPDNNYTVYYQSPSASRVQDLSSFSLQARPNHYGESGVRSYYVDEDGIIRATVEDRSANKGDAPIPACEWNPGKSCE